MPIIKKDGTVYRLRSPNPLGITQSDWGKDVEKINFKWPAIIVPDDSEFVPLQRNIKTSDKILELPPMEVTEEPKEIPTAEKPEPVLKPEQSLPDPQPTEKESVRPYLSDTVHMHCLPAEVSSYSDDLYDDHFQRNSYGEKFIFEAVIVNTNDLTMEFWTDTDRITEKSIVYPFRKQTSKGKYGPLKEYRWWKVTDIEEKSTGYLIRAVTSDVHPDFS